MERFDAFTNLDEYRKMAELLGDKLVKVYRNLHTGTWSVLQRGRVICHTDYIVLSGADFVVRPAGRAKVVREKRKNVHAFITGRVVACPGKLDDTGLKWEAVTYNPYKSAHFYSKETSRAVREAKYVDMCTGERGLFGDPVLAAN